MEITNEYKYLGLKLTPSGSIKLAVQELFEKASRAWFGISNTIYRNKRLEVKKALAIFDSLVTPVALYGTEFWLPHILSDKTFKNEKNLLNAWEVFTAEKLNQKCCRMILSVQNKTSRLAVLGELARYPLFFKSLAQCLNYKVALLNTKSNLLQNAVLEMKQMSDQGEDCWLSRVNKIEGLLKIIKPCFYNKTSGRLINSALRSKFDCYWLQKINELKIGENDTTNHNKLRTYNTFKASFTIEPYIELVRNRNQRAFLARLRVGSHNLAIELGRRTRPITPLAQRVCSHCAPPPTPLSRSPQRPSTSYSQQASIDTEFHFLMKCPKFTVKRNDFFDRISSIDPKFTLLTAEQKFLTLLCPVTAQNAKLVNRFIENMFLARNKIETNS